jgi:hypothetical protein
MTPRSVAFSIHIQQLVMHQTFFGSDRRNAGHDIRLMDAVHKQFFPSSSKVVTNIRPWHRLSKQQWLIRIVEIGRQANFLT